MSSQGDRTFVVIKKIVEKIKAKSSRDASFKRLFGDLGTFDGLKKFRNELDPNIVGRYSLRSFSMGLNITEEEADLFDNFFSADKSKFSKEEVEQFENIGISF